MKMSLYDITDAIIDLERAADAGDEGVEETLGEYLGELLPAKVENYAKFMRSLQLQSEAFKAEEKRIKERRQAMESIRTRMLQALQNSMERLECHELLAGTFKVKLCESPAAVDVVDDGLIPGDYQIVTMKLDKAAMKADLKNGKKVPGAVLRRSKHVRIR